MKILWIVNTIFPYPASKIGQDNCCFGGWLNGLANRLKNNKEVELAIATVYNGKEVKKYDDGNIVYYLIPGAPAIKYSLRMEKYWKIINDEFKPELVHIHGTEYAHGLAFKNACPSVKTVTSIQGLTSAISKVYYAGLHTSEILKNVTFRDIIKQDNIFQQKKKFTKRGKNEIELIKKTDAIIGRTIWDYANTKAINANEKYFVGNETLRDKFYNKEWNLSNVEKHSIFTSQASYPIKGLHYLLKAIYLLKQNYPDVKLYIAGDNIIDTSTFTRKIKINGYAKIIKKLIKKYNLEEQVNFTGILSEEKMIDQYLKSSVFVLPSAIENSSNSLGEAMLLGMPCVATNTGGTMDILEHKKEGFLYSYTEPAMCAYYISKYFEDDKLCIEYGENARKKALNRHNPENNTNQIIKIYNEIIGEKK